ncbi:MAG: AAA family ATPase [Ramlibacter sp.]|nr:AAA family ATPase [Ramlibacter sp.]
MQTADPASLSQGLSQCQVTALARSLHAELIETHISWVLLTADLAYKVKKPVKLPFVDYSTLEARRHFCEEEVRLNRRLAPGLYLGVAHIAASPGGPQIDGPGALLDYVVRMRRFPRGALFSERLEAGRLHSSDVDALAALLADFHARANPTANGFANCKRRRAVALAALEGVRPVARPDEQAALETWLQAKAALLAPAWARRLDGGFVRQCHGDLHLDNVIALPTGVAAFDCIEFDPALRWIDVIDDIAFPVMDFAARGRSDFAFRLLNAWLDRTGDHAGLPLLRFSAVYRALVRSQVAHLRGERAGMAARRYLETAIAWTKAPQRRLVITHGLPGSGKTFESQRVLEREGAIRIRSDVERKRLFGLEMLEDSRALGLDLYTADATARTYERLLELARGALQAGYPVVLDAAFLRRSERDAARELARELKVPFSILACEAPAEVLRARLLARRDDASEADARVLEHLRTSVEPLAADERQPDAAPHAAL